MKCVPSAGSAWLSLVLLVGLTSCSLVGSPLPSLPPNTLEANETLSALVTQTMASLGTPTTQAILVTLVPERTPPPTPLPPTATIPPATPSPSVTPVCDQAAAGSPIDVSIPDDSQMRPGQPFTKIWRLVNVGSCPWTTAYAASFFYGNQMDAPSVVPLTRPVAGGETAEIMVDMTAPQTPGTYQGNWKLRNAEGKLFGIGPGGDSPFWVRIVVLQVQTATLTPTNTPTVTNSPSATPSATPTPMPAVQANGALYLQLNAEVDLDSGAANPASGADLAYRKDQAGFHTLAGQNSAVFGLSGSSEPGISACQAATMSEAPLALESFSPGIYLCYRTDAGRYGWLRFNSFDAASEYTSLDFRTWALP